MSTMIHERDILYPKETRRGILIKSLRSAINAAEQGENEVAIEYNGIELLCNLEDGEIIIIG